MTKRSAQIGILVFGFWFLVAAPAGAEEEIGVVQKLWRKIFKKPPAAQEAAPQLPQGPIVEQEIIRDEVDIDSDEERTEPGEEGLAPEEEEARKDLVKDLEQQKRDRQLLEDIRQAQEAQKSRPPQPPR